jgi:glycine betaine/proline transport system substrate-binding protein
MPPSTTISSAEENVLRIRQGRIDLSFHQVVGEVFAYVLRDPRIFLSAPSNSGISAVVSPPAIKIEVNSAPHVDAFALLQKGETDILVGWFDGSHGAYLEPFKQGVIVLGESESEAGKAIAPPIYAPYCIWGVPSYIPESLVPDVPSLARPEVAARFKTTATESGEQRILQGITPGAGISRFSCEMIEKYRLDGQGWTFRNGTQEDCFGAFERAVENQGGSWCYCSHIRTVLI